MTPPKGRGAAWTEERGTSDEGRPRPECGPEARQTARLVVLVSGEGTNLQALIEACRDADYGARVVAVGADRDRINALSRAERAGIPTFTVCLADYPAREAWDAALARACAASQSSRAG